MNLSDIANAIDADCYYCGLATFGGMVAGGRDHIIHWCHEDPDEVVMEMSVRLMARHICDNDYAHFKEYEQRCKSSTTTP